MLCDYIDNIIDNHSLQILHCDIVLSQLKLISPLPWKLGLCLHNFEHNKHDKVSSIMPA